MIRVVLVDDQALVRAGFRLILQPEPDIEVVGEAGDGRQAVDVVLRQRPDVVLMDVRMPGVDGIEAARRLFEAGARAGILMLTTFDLDEYVYDALAAGASGFVLKDIRPEELATAVRTIARGEALLAPTVTRRLISTYARRRYHPPPRKDPPLTERERDVLQLLARGLANQEIAARLGVSETTVKTHVGHVLDKLELRDRVQAVIFAYEAGIVEPGRS